jgi:DNA end-binding protein Ku
MARRANWKGYLKLSLVSCAVALFPATTRRDRLHFNILNRETGNRVRYQVVDAESGEEVPEDERVKGYQISKGHYVLVEDEEFDQVALESTHTIDIEHFVPRPQVDQLYLDESYYIVPDDKVGHEAFAVIREAMREKELVGIARVVLHRREHLVMLEPRGKGIVGTLLRFANEVRDEHDYFDHIPASKVPKDMLELAEHILKTKQAAFDPSEFQDRYESALKKLIKAKQAGKEPPKAAPPQGSNVINLMDALRRSARAGRERGSQRRHRGRARSAVRSGSARGKKLKRAS